MKRQYALVAFGALAAFAGCTQPQQSAPLAAPPPASPAAAHQATASKPSETTVKVQPAVYKRDVNDPFQKEAYTEPEFELKAPEYKATSDLSNVANWRQFAPSFDAAQRVKLAQNLFLVLPANRLQMSFTYEENNYTPNNKTPETPSFITTDSVLHTFHVFYDYLMRSVESDALYPAAAQMTHALLEGSLQQLKDAQDPDMKAAALKNVAYLLVPATALMDAGTLPVPQEARQLAAAEWKLVQAHQGEEPSPLFGYSIDYSQFIPRGHYTRSEKLTRYFLAMMWYGYTPLMIRDKTGTVHPEQVRQAALLGSLLAANAKADNGAGAQWRRIYEPTAFMVGVSDDVNTALFADVVNSIAGEKPLAEALSDSETVQRIVDETARRYPAQIVNGARSKELPVKLMGQRFVVDSYIMQNLIYPNVGTDKKARVYPFGLDLFSAFGSERAFDILKTVYKQGDFANYDSQMQSMRSYVESIPPDLWQRNIYWGWMDVLRRVVAPKAKGYPSLMRSDVWQDKSLNAALGSWAELRHDTILYAKQVTAECGEGGDDETNKPPRGYVEPDIRVYHRLKFLLNQLWSGLKARGYLDEYLNGQCGQFDELLGFLVTVSRKELANERLTNEEEDTIHNYGDTISRLNMFTKEVKTTRNGEAWSQIFNETDHDMAVAADVHTNLQEGKVLQANVGHANEIYAIFPAKGKLWVGRGAVFSYYEFTHPMNDRLTDEKWQQMLAGKQRPALPVWIKSFCDVKAAKHKEKLEDRYLEDTRSTGGC